MDNISKQGKKNRARGFTIYIEKNQTCNVINVRNPTYQCLWTQFRMHQIRFDDSQDYPMLTSDLMHSKCSQKLFNICVVFQRITINLRLKILWESPRNQDERRKKSVACNIHSFIHLLQPIK